MKKIKVVLKKTCKETIITSCRGRDEGRKSDPKVFEIDKQGCGEVL